MPADVASTVPDKLTGYENQSGLHSLLEACAARLRTHTLIAAKGLRVLPEYHADMYNSLVRVMNAKLSVFAMIGFSIGNASHASVANILKDLRIEVNVFENVLINMGATGTKVSALSYAEACLTSLHWFTPEASGALVKGNMIRMAESGTIGLNQEKSQLTSGLVCYTARFVTSHCIACHCG